MLPLALAGVGAGASIAQKFYADNLPNLANWPTAAWLLQWPAFGGPKRTLPRPLRE